MRGRAEFTVNEWSDVTEDLKFEKLEKFNRPSVQVGVIIPRFSYSGPFCVGGEGSGSASGLIKSGRFAWADCAEFNVNEQSKKSSGQHCLFPKIQVLICSGPYICQPDIVRSL